MVQLILSQQCENGNHELCNGGEKKYHKDILLVRDYIKGENIVHRNRFIT